MKVLIFLAPLLLVGCINANSQPDGAPDDPMNPRRKSGKELPRLAGTTRYAFPPMIKDLKTKTPILVYHDIIQNRDAKSVWFDCTVEELRNQLGQMQKAGANFITLDTLYAHLTRNAPLPDHAVVITAADGYRGFYELGFPEFKKLNAPVAMFVHTDMVGKTQGRPKMSWDQLRELEKSGVVRIFSQTVSHPADLSKLSQDQIGDELLNSRKQIESELKRDCLYLAYPNGKWDKGLFPLLRRNNYWMAMTEACMPAEKSPDIHAIARYVHTKWKQAWQDCYGPLTVKK